MCVELGMILFAGDLGRRTEIMVEKQNNSNLLILGNLSTNESRVPNNFLFPICLTTTSVLARGIPLSLIKLKESVA